MAYNNLPYTITAYDFTAYKNAAYDFMTFVLRPVENVSVSLYFSWTQSKDGLYSSYDEPYPSYDEPYPSYYVPLSIIWWTPVHHMIDPKLSQIRKSWITRQYNDVSKK